MHRIYIPSHVSATHCDPILIFEKGNGEAFSFPGRNDAPTPEGYTRRELQPAEARRVLQRVNRLERRKIEDATETECRILEGIQAMNRPDLFHAMRSMSPQQRAFAQLAIDYNNRKRGPTSADPNVYIEALEFDSGSRDAWADRDRRGRSRK